MKLYSLVPLVMIVLVALSPECKYEEGDWFDFMGDPNLWKEPVAAEGWEERHLAPANKFAQQAVSTENLSKGKDSSFAEIDAAIKQVPGDPYGYLLRASMLVAQGKDPNTDRDLSAALGIFSADEGGARQLFSYRETYVQALVQVRQNVPPGGPQANQLDQQLCGQWAAAEQREKGSGARLAMPKALKCG